MKLRTGTPDEVGMSAARMRHVADLAQGWVDQGLTPALVVLVARRGVIVLHEAFGRLTPAADAPALPQDTIFPMASISKPITATAIMTLVEEGRLGLNRPVIEYIPELRGEGKQAMMVHHLLTHTSGLRDEDIWPHTENKYLAGLAVPPPTASQHPMLHRWLTYGYDIPLWKRPGIEMSYSNYGYELLGEIVRRVSGQSLHDFATERIFAPLGMKDSGYITPEHLAPRVIRRSPTAYMASPQNPEWGAMPTIIHAIYGGFDSRTLQVLPAASGGVFTTAEDLAIFGQLFLNRGHYGDQRLLSPTTIAAMTRNQIPGISAEYNGEYLSEASWGFGWEIHGQKKPNYDGTLHSPQTFSHGGAGGVYFWVDPVYELVGIYFSVVQKPTDDGHHPIWQVDYFVNAVTAAIIDE
jgi:CubicO group peptidase (beta-lactamase class C family)